MVQRTGGIFSAAVDAAEPTAALLTPAAAPLRNFAKDLDYVLAEAATAHLRLPATAAARVAVSRAAGLGRDGADWASVALQHQESPATPPAAPSAAAAAPAATPREPFHSLAALEASLPPPWREEERALLLRCAALGGRHGPLAVIDDDPTGTQTVRPSTLAAPL